MSLIMFFEKYIYFFRFVSKLFAHFEKLHSLATRWDKYEHDVKSLLNWIMSEANRFSGELTTQGDKGIEDHILSCKVSIVTHV